MRPAASGEARLARRYDHAEALEAEGHELLARAGRVRASGERIAKGNEGERVVGALLDELVPEGWVVLHDRRKRPGSPANLDHVAVGPPGVVVIDAKNWTGRLRWDGRGMAIGSWRKDDELHRALVDAELVATAVPGAPTSAVLAFVQDVGLPAPVRHHDVVLLQQERLLTWLRDLPPGLTAHEVRHLGQELEAAFPARSTSYKRPPKAYGPARLAVAEPATPATAPRLQDTEVDSPRERERASGRRSVALMTALIAVLALLVLVLAMAQG